MAKSWLVKTGAEAIGPGLVSQWRTPIIPRSMSRISRQEVEKVAHLARLRLSPEEVGAMTADLDAIRIALDEFPGVTLVDDRDSNKFPMPLESSGLDDVLVGRLRRKLDPDRSLSPIETLRGRGYRLRTDSA